MVTLGRTVNIQGELYEIVRTVTVTKGTIPGDIIEGLKRKWHAEKTYIKDTTYYFVNEIKTITIEDERPDQIEH